jgi:hypothetical protein
MFDSILGARLSWHFANGWVFEPAIVGPDNSDDVIARLHDVLVKLAAEAG